MMRRESSQKTLAKNPADQRARLELNIKVYERILQDELKKAPVPPKYQV